MAKVTSLILRIKISDNNTILLTKDNKKQEITFGDKTYEMSIQDIAFEKKMYAPGEITADILFKLSNGTGWTQIERSTLAPFFKKKEVSLSYGDSEQDANGKWTTDNEKSICEGYYIHELSPCYYTDKMVVTMKIYSPDKTMTIQESCNSWVAKRLARDIVDGQKANYKLPYNNNGTLNYDYDGMQFLHIVKPQPEKKETVTENGQQVEKTTPAVEGKEVIFPYLVQYNESYYDFLVRTCNRWGEFLYYEDKKMHIGYNDKTVKNIDTFETITYCNLNSGQLAHEGISSLYADGTTHDTPILNNPLTKSDYDAVKAVIGCDKDNGGDIWATKIIGNLLSSGKNLYDYIVDTTVDELILMGQAKKKSSDKNGKFDDEYFKNADIKDSVKGTQYDSGGSKFNQFAAIEPKITTDLYKTVLAGETEAAQNAICINFDIKYQDYKLGDIVTIQGGTTKYIVVQVNTKTEEKTELYKGTKLVTTKKLTYQAIAIAKNGNYFYPTLHPAGHIRKSGPQRAKVVKESKLDPKRQNRVRVQFPWQGGSDMTPWLEFARPGGNKGTGSYNRHYENEEVIVAFANDNLERPYVVGALSTGKQTVPASTYTNDIVQVTPGGQAIKMSDGTGSGFSAFMAGMSPGWKLVTGFTPGFKLPGLDFENNKSFEGSIELADKYGIYSIKGSTDGRNVTIKSPYGDVKLSAFTGITISAPNGDVKIAGKNVTIEAGNNLTLTSGKNVKDGFWLSYMGKDMGKAASWGLTIAAAVTKKVASIVGGFIDLSVARHFLEVFMRPIEGKLQVKSNRYLALEAGKGKTSYPIDAYRKANHKDPDLSKIILRMGGKASEQSQKDATIIAAFNAIPNLGTKIYNQFKGKYNNAKTTITDLERLVNECTTGEGNNQKLPTKKVKEMLDALWGNPSNVDDIIGFQNLLVETNKDNIQDEQTNFFSQGINIDNPTDMQRKEYAVTRITHYRNEIHGKVDALKTQIKDIKDFTPDASIAATRLENNIKTALKAANLYTDAYFKKCSDDENFKYFKYTVAEIDEKIRQHRKPLLRKMFIVLVDKYQFKRAKAGGVMGVGAEVPEAPDPFKDGIEADWNTYVNSIQEMPKVKSDDYSAKDFFKDTLLDPILKQNGIQPFLKDAMDNYSFGSNKSGQILFSNGGNTMVLDSQISRANTDGAEDAELEKSGAIAGKAKQIRNAMMEG